MRSLLVLAALALATSVAPMAQTAPAHGGLYPGLDGEALRDAIRQDHTPALTLGYGPARDSLYTFEMRAYGQLCGVYTRFCVLLDPAADPSTDAFLKGINAEHTWPQSRGAEAEPYRSDLHALFPAKDNVNSSRGNHPYAEIPDAQTEAWYRDTQSQSVTPTVFIDEWSERTTGYAGTPYGARFEPREAITGDIARAVAYFAAVHEPVVDAYDERLFLTTMLADLQAWNAEDPPDAVERARSSQVATWQGNENPFVLDPSLLGRAFADYSESIEPPPPAEDGVLWVNEIHYDDVSTDEGEFIELAGVAGTDLDGWRFVLYNGNGGAIYDDRLLTGTVPDESMGIGAIAVSYPSNGIQNGSPDAIALVDPSGAVVQFLSYEGVVTATEGPAAGLASVDIGVEESNTTPEGLAVGLSGSGRASSDFSWTGPAPASPGALNGGQSIAPAVTREGGPVAVRLGAPRPNPAADHVSVQIEAPVGVPTGFVLVDALGRTVVEGRGPLGSGRVRVPVSRLAPGLYLVRVMAGEHAATARVTVAR